MRKQMQKICLKLRIINLQIIIHLQIIILKTHNHLIKYHYSIKKFAEKLRRLADALEAGEQFRIQVAGKRVIVPKDAEISIAHERGAGEEEIEFQLKWEY